MKSPKGSSENRGPRFAVIEAPRFRLQALRYASKEPLPAPVVLMQGGRVGECDQPAARLGVEHGMNLSQVMARSDQIRCLDPSQRAEELFNGFLIGLALRFTSRVERTSPGLYTLDISRAPPVDRNHWEEKAVQPAAQTGVNLRVGVAETPDLARYAAWFGNPVKEVDCHQAFLKTVPVKAVAPAQMVPILRGWGVRMLSDLMGLSREDLARRLGPDGVELWDRTTGRKIRFLRIEDFESNPEASLDLEAGIESRESLLFLIRRLLDQVFLRLEASRQAMGILIIEMETEVRKRLREKIRFSEPTTDADFAFRRIGDRLEQMQVSESIQGLSLRAVPVEVQPAQADFLRPGLRYPGRWQETLRHLQRIVGEDRVGCVSPLRGHAPDCFRLRTFGEELPDEEGEPMPCGPVLRRFRPPRPAWVASDREGPTGVKAAWFSGAVVSRRGPWMGSGDWWKEDGWRRVEWDVELENQALLRLVCESGRWFLEGAYE